MMRVSLIIPTYNRREYVLAVLETIQEQDFDFRLLEVIVADNGSTDGTREAILSLSCNFPICVLTLPKESSFEAARLRNRAAEAAGGDIFIFVDSDILLPRDFIRSHLSYYSSPDDLVSVIGTVYYLENKQYSQNINEILKEETLTVDPLERDYTASTECGVWNPLAWMLYHAGNVSITRKAFELSSGFDEWHREWSIEDLDFGFQLQKCGVRLVYSRYAYGLHKWHESSGKNSDSIDTGFEYLKNKENGNALVRYAHEDMMCMQTEKSHSVTRTSLAKRIFYLDSLKLTRPGFKTPDFTIAVYSPGVHQSLFRLLDLLELQYNGCFEVLVVDDSDSIEKDAALQTRNYGYPFRLFHVDWKKEKTKYLINHLQCGRLSKDQTLGGIEKMFVQALVRSEDWYGETLHKQFETFVYDQALGGYIKIIQDQEEIGETFIRDLYRDLLNETEKAEML